MPFKILVVEDHSDSREMLICLLSQQGYTVLAAENGSSGLLLAESECPDLIITDVHMPELDGIEMIRRLRNMGACTNTPIIVLSAYIDGNEARAVSAGATMALPKPVSVKSLNNAIGEVLSHR
jgi:CheY-like chemotaxis protein